MAYSSIPRAPFSYRSHAEGLSGYHPSTTQRYQYPMGAYHPSTTKRFMYPTGAYHPSTTKRYMYPLGAETTQIQTGCNPNTEYFDPATGACVPFAGPNAPSVVVSPPGFQPSPPIMVPKPPVASSSSFPIVPVVIGAVGILAVVMLMKPKRST